MGFALEDSEPVEIQNQSVLHAQRTLVKSLTEMVHSDLELLFAEFATPICPSLSSWWPPQWAQTYPLHLHLEEVIFFCEWAHPDRMFVLPKIFEQLMEDKFAKRWGTPAVDAAVSCLNKNLA